MSSKRFVDAGVLKKGTYIIVNNEPCKVVDTTHSKAGKHGHAKVRVVSLGIFTGKKYDTVHQVDEKLDAPALDKRNGQILSITSDSVLVMDLESHQTMEIGFPEEEDLAKALVEGASVEYWDVMGRKLIQRVKGAA